MLIKSSVVVGKNEVAGGGGDIGTGGLNRKENGLMKRKWKCVGCAEKGRTEIRTVM